MTDDEKNIELFDRYTSGELSGMEKDHLEQRLSSEPELAAAFKDYLAFRESMISVGRQNLKQEFRAVESSIDPSLIKKYEPGRGLNIGKSGRNWKMMTWVMIGGSALLLIAFVIALFNLPDLEKKLKGQQVGVIEHEETVIEVIRECQVLGVLPYSDDRESSENFEVDVPDGWTIDACSFDDESLLPNLLYKRTTEGDSLYAINWPCESMTAHWAGTKDTLLLKCDDHTFVVYENGWAPLQFYDMESTSDSTNFDETPEPEADSISAVEPNVEHLDSTSQDLIETHGVHFELPKYPGGQPALVKYIQENIRYPERAKRANRTGTVIIEFKVMKDGSLRELRIHQGLGLGCDEEVIRLVNAMPNWIPAHKGATKYNYLMHLPVYFKPREKEPDYDLQHEH